MAIPVSRDVLSVWRDSDPQRTCLSALRALCLPLLLIRFVLLCFEAESHCMALTVFRTHSVDKVGLKLTEVCLPASAFPVLGLRACATRPDPLIYLMGTLPCLSLM